MKRKINRYFLGARLLALFVLPSLLWAQAAEVGLRMDVDKRQVEVGDSLTLTLEFKQLGSGNASVIQEPSIPTPENFEIRGTSSSTQVMIINRQTAAVSTTRLTLVANKVGTETLGPALLIYQDAQGQKKEMKSNIVTVTVVEKTGFSFFGKKKAENPPPPAQPSAAPASVSADDLRGIKGLPPESFPWFKVTFCLVLLAVIVGFIWRQLSKPAKKTVKAAPQGKAAELREALKKLGDEKLSAKEFCLGLSNVLRECLEYRFDFSALDYTSEEILKELKKQKVSEEEQTTVEKCLKTCDRVLYADGNLTGRDNLRAACSSLLPKANKN
jgi:hypothetical protein